MQSLKQWLASFTRNRRGGMQADPDLDAILRNGMRFVRSADPGTQNEWSRLRVEIARRTAERPSRARVWIAVAGAAAVVLAVMMLLRNEVPAREMYQTTRGEWTTVVLPDSSVVVLNHTTSVTAEGFTGAGPRRIRLSGEAFFRVRHTGTPFIVSNAFAEARVLGTEFNVRDREGAFEVSVVQGSVAVSSLDPKEGNAIVLAHHQRAVCTNGGIPARLADLTTDDAPDWIHGRLTLAQTTLARACREVEERFDVTVRIAGGGDQMISGVLDARTAHAALSALGALTGKQLTRDGSTFTLR